MPKLWSPSPSLSLTPNFPMTLGLCKTSVLHIFKEALAHILLTCPCFQVPSSWWLPGRHQFLFCELTFSISGHSKVPGCQCYVVVCGRVGPGEHDPFLGPACHRISDEWSPFSLRPWPLFLGSQNPYQIRHRTDTRPRICLPLPLSPEVFLPLFALKWKAPQINSSKNRMAGILSPVVLLTHWLLTGDSAGTPCFMRILHVPTVAPQLIQSAVIMEGGSHNSAIIRTLKRLWKLAIVFISNLRVPNRWTEVMNNVPQAVAQKRDEALLQHLNIYIHL